MRGTTEFNRAVAKNMMLKSRILSFVFLGLVVLQLPILFILLMWTDLTDNIDPVFVPTAPVMMTAAFLAEYYFFRKLRKNLEKNDNLTESAMRYSWVVVLAEISLPSVLILIGHQVINPEFFREKGVQLLNSPPFILYFILIILNALSLDFKLCLFSGLLAGIQYVTLALFLGVEGKNEFVIFNIFIKGMLIIVCGITTGLVSKKIKESVLSSLEAKEKLINELDKMVQEKTVEIRLQKEELEEKNRDIVSSITYASRIQRALMAPEQSIGRKLNELKYRSNKS